MSITDNVHAPKIPPQDTYNKIWAIKQLWQSLVYIVCKIFRERCLLQQNYWKQLVRSKVHSLLAMFSTTYWELIILIRIRKEVEVQSLGWWGKIHPVEPCRPLCHHDCQHNHLDIIVFLICDGKRSLHKLCCFFLFFF